MDPESPMKMRPRGSSRRSHLAQDIPLADLFSFPGKNFRKVEIHRIDSLSMVEDNGFSGEEKVIDQDHRTRNSRPGSASPLPPAGRPRSEGSCFDELMILRSPKGVEISPWTGRRKRPFHNFSLRARWKIASTRLVSPFTRSRVFGSKSTIEDGRDRVWVLKDTFLTSREEAPARLFPP